MARREIFRVELRSINRVLGVVGLVLITEIEIDDEGPDREPTRLALITERQWARRMTTRENA